MAKKCEFKSLPDSNLERRISLVAAVQNKYEENANAIRIRLSDPNIIYFPYAKNELKVNPMLTQNPAFAFGEDSQYAR